MQVDRLNHLLFPPDQAQAALKKDHAAGPGLGAGPGALHANARSRAPVVHDRVLPPQAAPRASVVLNLKTDGTTPTPPTLTDTAQAPVYSHGRKIAPPDDAAGETDKKAVDHQVALDRHAGVFTRMSVDKDGVLVVAKPQTSKSHTPSDFVSHAVSVMRELKDQADRMPGQEPPAKLTGLQQLAARFNVFG